jgi:hypothetical protein
MLLAEVSSALKLGIQPDREATRKLLEHLLSLRVDEGFALFPSMVFRTAEGGRPVHHEGETLRFAGTQPGQALSVPFSI